MEASQFDTMAKAAATGVSRRQLLRGLLAAAGGATLLHFTGGVGEARLSRCCRRAKQAAKEQCSVATGGRCPQVISFSCQKIGPGTCKVITLNCATNGGAVCV
jgi:hypothetical protein